MRPVRPVRLVRAASGASASAEPGSGQGEARLWARVWREARRNLGAAVAGAKGALTGGALHGTGTLDRLGRTLAMGLWGGGQAAVEGGGPAEITAGAVTMGGLGMAGPDGGTRLREVFKRVKKENPTMTDAEALEVANSEAGSEYRAMGNNPTDYIQTPDGSVKFGEIDKDIAQVIRRQPGDIRLQVKGMSKLGYVNSESFIHEIATNWTEIREGGSGSLIIAKKNGPDKVASIKLEPSESGDFYTVTSAWLGRPNYLKKFELLGERNVPSPIPTGKDLSNSISSQLQPGEESRDVKSPSSSADLNILTPEPKNNPTFPKIGEAIRAAKTKAADAELYVVNGPEGYTIAQSLPENQSYVKINPDGTQEFVGSEAKPKAQTEPPEPPDGGTTMGAGFIPIPGKKYTPPEKLFDASGDPLAKKVQDMYGQADKELYDLRNPGYWKYHEKVKRALVDVSGNLGKKLLDSGNPYAKRTRIAFDLARGASAKAKADWDAAQERIYDVAIVLRLFLSL